MATLVYHGHAKDVDLVMVDGRVRVRAGVVLDVDEDALLDAAGNVQRVVTLFAAHINLSLRPQQSLNHVNVPFLGSRHERG